MKRKTEIKFIIFLIAVFLLSCGLLTRLQLNESIDIQLYDTYYIIYNSQLILILAVILMTAYLFTFATKRLSKINRGLKFTMILLNGFFATIITALLLATIVASLQTEQSLWNIEVLGVVTALLGTATLFVFRTIEIYRLK